MPGIVSASGSRQADSWKEADAATVVLSSDSDEEADVARAERPREQYEADAAAVVFLLTAMRRQMLPGQNGPASNMKQMLPPSCFF